MKYVQLNAFEKHLKAAKGHFADCYLLIAKKEYERQSAKESLLANLLADQRQGNVIKFRGGEHSFHAIYQEMSTVNLFQGKKIVVIEGIDKLAKKEIEQLQLFLAEPLTISLVLTAASYLKQAPLYQRVEKIGIILDSAAEKPWEKQKILASWLIDQAAHLKKKLDQDAAQYLAQLFSGDAALLFKELEKIACYVGERRQINRLDIEAICAPYKEQTVYSLTAALFNFEGKKALALFNDLVNQDLPLLVLLRQIRTQYQNSLNLISLFAQGGKNAILQKFPQYSPQWVDKQIALSQRYGLKKLSKGVLLIDEVESYLKNNSQYHKLKAELLIYHLSS